jgi:hypothetical protein
MNRQIIPLVFRVEVETSDTSSAAIAAIIDDIDDQVSGQLRELRIKDGTAARSVDYQAVSMHGQERGD